MRRVHGSSPFDFTGQQVLTDEQAADAVQEALLRLCRELRQGSAIENPLAWTYRPTYRLVQ